MELYHINLFSVYKNKDSIMTLYIPVVTALDDRYSTPRIEENNIIPASARLKVSQKKVE